MRTAVVRVGVDPAGVLGDQQLSDGMATLRGLLAERGAEVLDNQLAGLPAHRREVEVLIAGDDAPELQAIAMELCAKAFGTAPTAGVVTFVSRGTTRTPAVCWPGSACRVTSFDPSTWMAGMW